MSLWIIPSIVALLPSWPCGVFVGVGFGWKKISISCSISVATVVSVSISWSVLRVLIMN